MASQNSQLRKNKYPGLHQIPDTNNSQFRGPVKAENENYL